MPYSFNEAQHLLKYYSEKMIGQYLDIERQVKIKELKSDQLKTDKSKYLVRACGQRNHRGILLFKEIGGTAKLLNLPSPELLLLDLNLNL